MRVGAHGKQNGETRIYWVEDGDDLEIKQKT